MPEAPKLVAITGSTGLIGTALRRSLEAQWFLKEERRTSDQGSPSERPRSRVASGLEALRRNVSRFGDGGRGREPQAMQGELRVEPI